MNDIPEIPHSRENAVRFFVDYVNNHGQTLTGLSVVDLSAGSGFIAQQFVKTGAHVRLFDLFPEQNTFCSLPCQHIDLTKTWPLETASVDLLILAETIEHLPDTHFFFQEAGRVLKTGGILLLTTPNSASLRSRFSQFLMESEHYSHPAPNELDAFTRWGNGGYFGKLFINGLLRLRTLAALHQLRIKTIHRSPASSTSVWLMVFYPLIYYFSQRNYRRQFKNDPQNEPVYREIFTINTSTKNLLSKHLIIEFTKK
jgi:SAM-dependent methyltransferase